MNVMEINGSKAVIAYDPDINLFPGEFIELSGGADLDAADVDTLPRRGHLDNPLIRRFRESGNPVESTTWISAFPGMTVSEVSKGSDP